MRGWRPKALVPVGLVVKKTGRTTNFTTGRITAINPTVNVGYGSGRVARFVDQIVTTTMFAGGDSGSLVLTLDNVAVGLLYAGSAVAMIANQIENVRALLRVEVAEQILEGLAEFKTAAAPRSLSAQMLGTLRILGRTLSVIASIPPYFARFVTVGG